MGLFQKYHNTLLCPSKISQKHCFQFLLGQIIHYCWFAHNVTAFVFGHVGGKWTHIFMSILREKILLYWPPTLPSCHMVAKQDWIGWIYLSKSVVIGATLGPDQSQHSKISLDQSESRISPMWLMWRHIAHIWAWFYTWPIGIKNTRTQELNPHSLHSFIDRVKPWVQAGRVWRPIDVTPITNLITDRVHVQFFRSHRDNWIGWLPRWRACQTPTHTASRAEPLEFVSVPNPVWNNKGW